MSISRTLVIVLFTLAAAVRCSSNGSANDGGTDGGGVSCTGQQAVCPGHPYAACVEVQNAAGHCVDWSMVGATACSNGPQDCPTTLPSASFPAVGGSSTTTTTAVCVKATDIQLSSGLVSPGYCAATQTYSDPTALTTCTPNPCGPTGYCSYIDTSLDLAVVTCLWPI